jgi:hypothetical protein
VLVFVGAVGGVGVYVVGLLLPVPLDWLGLGVATLGTVVAVEVLVLLTLSVKSGIVVVPPWGFWLLLAFSLIYSPVGSIINAPILTPMISCLLFLKVAISAFLYFANSVILFAPI